MNQTSCNNTTTSQYYIITMLTWPYNGLHTTLINLMRWKALPTTKPPHIVKWWHNNSTLWSQQETITLALDSMMTTRNRYMSSWQCDECKKQKWFNLLSYLSLYEPNDFSCPAIVGYMQCGPYYTPASYNLQWSSPPTKYVDLHMIP